MHRREVVGLVLLVIAVAVSAGFFATGSKDDSGGRVALPIQTPVPPTPTPANRNRTTPSLNAQFPPVPDRAWQIATVSFAENNVPLAVKVETRRAIDINLTAPPSPDLKEGVWGVQAAGDFLLTAEPWAFVVEHTGDVQVLIDGVEVAAQPGAPLPVLLRVDFVGKGSVSTTIQIIARATSELFILKYHAPAPIVVTIPTPTATPKP
jgi:hypothetical protein